MKVSERTILYAAVMGLLAFCFLFLANGPAGGQTGAGKPIAKALAPAEAKFATGDKEEKEEDLKDLKVNRLTAKSITVRSADDKHSISIIQLPGSGVGLWVTSPKGQLSLCAGLSGHKDYPYLAIMSTRPEMSKGCNFAITADPDGTIQLVPNPKDHKEGDTKIGFYTVKEWAAAMQAARPKKPAE